MQRPRRNSRLSCVLNDLRDVLANQELGRKEKVLAILALGEPDEKPVRLVRELGVQHGLTEIEKWNLSDILSRQLKGFAIRVPDGWAITDRGRRFLQDKGIIQSSPSVNMKPALRGYVTRITDERTTQFVEEAIRAVEHKLYRAAVVLSWVGAVSLLYGEVVHNHLPAFNTETRRRFPKWKDARTADDLARLKEYDFLQILAAISVIGKNTKDQLENCLKLRNACGHPNSYNIGEYQVASHIETLILNVYAEYAL